MKEGFIFFQGYNERLWEGYKTKGFLSKNTGVRLFQSIDVPENEQFNEVLKAGSPLRRLIEENGYPIYVDRLQGGCYIDNYSYDFSIIDALGDRFKGFQIHEWMSNLRSDYAKLAELSSEEWNCQSITDEIFRRFPFPHLFLEAATAEEFAEELPVPHCHEDFRRNAEHLFKKRTEETKGNLIACDSSILPVKIEVANNVRGIFAECGNQTPCANIQLALVRGMARAYGLPYGLYYEPWGGSPFSACDYNIKHENEWYIADSADFPFQTQGPNGGSSRSLQKRLFYYAYMSGVNYLSEEWGAFNTFTNTEDYEISEYGKTKLDFIRFTEKVPQGDIYTPFVIVLPKELTELNLPLTGQHFWSKNPDEKELAYYGMEARLHERLVSLMFNTASKFGNEVRVLPNSGMPDVFDIVFEDSKVDFARYKYLVDLTNGNEFGSTHENVITADEVCGKLGEVMPCRVEGDLFWFVSNTASDCYLTVFNNDGIDRTVENGELQLPEATRTAVITTDGKEFVPLKNEGTTQIKDGKIYVTLKAGEMLIGKLKPSDSTEIQAAF